MPRTHGAVAGTVGPAGRRTDAANVVQETLTAARADGWVVMLNACTARRDKPEDDNLLEFASNICDFV